MALQIRRGTNAERLGITLVEGEVVYVTDFELTTITVTSINATTNILTTTLNHGLAVNDQIKYIGATANGLTEGTVYWVKTIPSQTEFTLSTTQGGGTLDITGTATSLVFAVGPTDALGVPYGYSISPLYVGDGVTAGGNPAGAGILDDLYDVTIGVYGNVGQYGKALGDGHVLVYNDETNQWENSNVIATNVANNRLVVQFDASNNAANSALILRKNYGATSYGNNDGVGLKFELSSTAQGDDEIALITAVNTSGGININFATTTDDGATYVTPLTLNDNGSTFRSNVAIENETLSINSDNTLTSSRIYFNGTNGSITYNNATNFFDFGNNIARGDTYISSGAIASGTGPLSLNTPSGQSVNVQRDLVVGGNLTVNGTTTTVNSTTLTVDDKNIELASTASPSDTTADGGGITLKGTTDKKIFWDNATDRWYYDHGDGVNNIFVRDLTDLNNVETTAFTKGDMFYYNGTNWVNTNKVEADTSARRSTFQYNNNDHNLSSAIFARKNFTSPEAYTTGDGTGIAIQLSNDNATPITFAALSASYDAANPAVVLRTSTDSFVANNVYVGSFDNNDVKFHGRNITLNAYGTGSAQVDAFITVERGTTGADAFIKWETANNFWRISNDSYTDGSVISGTSIGTNGDNFYFNNDDQGTGATSTIHVKRGANADVAFRWNETSDRWESTTDGSSYITLPNQGLDTGNTPTFAGATLGNIKIAVTDDNRIDMVTGDLTIDAPTTTMNGSLVVTGSTTLGNATGDTVLIASGTVNIGTTLTSTTTIGDAATDTLVVNATSTFNNNLTVGSDATDTLTVNSTANFNNNVTLGSGSTDTLTVNASASLLNDVSLASNTGTNNTVTIGNSSGDELYVNATSYINNNLTVGSTSGDTLTVNSSITGNLTFTDNSTGTPRGVTGTVGTNDHWFVGGASAGANDGYMVIATGDDGTEPIYVRQYSGNPAAGGSGVVRQLTLLDASGNTSLPGSLTVTGDLTVNGTTTTLDTQNLVVEDNIILLNKNESGGGITAGSAGIEIERGSLANVSWQYNETNAQWEVGGPSGTQNIWAAGNIISGNLLATNGTNLFFNYDDGAGADALITVKKGGGATADIKWNNATNRWQTSVDGSTYLNIPNQNLDTNSDVAFSQVTVDGLTTLNTQSTTTIATTATSISSTTRKSQKAIIKIVDNVSGDVHMLEALVFYKGTTAYITTYAEMYSNAALATFTADISGGVLSIVATPASTNSTTFTVARISLD